VSANQAPVISALSLASPTNFHTGGAITATVTASDPDGDPIEFQWTRDGLVVQAWGSATSYPSTPGAADVGPHTLTVEVRDPAGATASASKAYTIYRLPPPMPVRNP
jgi:hypothetical protein